MPKSKDDKDDLLNVVKMFQAIADDDNADPEERRKARAVVRSYYEDSDEKPKSKAMRPQLRIVPPPPPTAAELQAARQAMDYAALPHAQRRALDRLDSHYRPGGEGPRREGAALVLAHMTREQAAQRALELSGGTSTRPAINLADVESAIARHEGRR